MCEYELPMSRLSEVIVWQTNRQTDRQTGPKLYIMPLRGWSTSRNVDNTNGNSAEGAGDACFFDVCSLPAELLLDAKTCMLWQ